jgi:hypothetical protein
MKKFITYLFSAVVVCFSAQSLLADDDNPVIQNNILYFKDPRVDVLQKMYMRNKTKKDLVTRVQIFQATSRDQVFEARAQFSARFPGIQTFITYATPNFKLRVGEFDSKQEAHKFMMQLKAYFPTSFVIEEKAIDEDKKPKAKN